MNKFLKLSCTIAAIALSSTALATTTVTVKDLRSATAGASFGTVSFTDSQYGLLITLHLHGLPAGLHGFHVHVNGSCAKQGMAAGGHLDPANTGKHLGPYANGHLGDLPALYVDANGNATQVTLAPRLHEKDLVGHSLMVHAGGDNYSDVPAKLGGGGARLGCGVFN